ncbi:MAG: hypothetical protein NTV97_33705 [Alphaproteobacteria bacterium]|nr:hypothetical protein [Alphaproteobacteria bacterium]
MSDTPPGRQRPNFLQFLGRFDGGAVVDRLTSELEEIVAAQEQVAQDHGVQASTGELVITVKFKRKKGTYDVTIDSKSKKPKAPTSAEVMWATETNNLVPENPRQQKFGFTEIVRPRGSDA